MNKDARSIKFLEEKAKQQDFFAISQLMEYYNTGQFVTEKDEIKANHYLEEAKRILEQSNYVLKNITINNIKRIDELELNFHPQLTVIIGENAVGKTSICESIAKFLSWIPNKILGKNGASIPDNQIKKGTDFAKIFGQILLSENDILAFYMAKGNTEASNYEKNNLLAYAINKILETKENQLDLSLFAFYGVDRTAKNTKKDNLEYQRKDAYSDSLHEKTRVSNVESWIIKCYESTNPEFELNSIGEIFQIEDDVNELIENLEPKMKKDFDELQGQDFASIYKNLGRLFQEMERFKNIEKHLINDENQRSFFEKYDVDRFFKIVNSCLIEFIPELKKMTIGFDKLLNKTMLYFDFQFYKVPFEQLSHGQKSVINMVSDIIYRMIILNPQMEDPRKTKGIIVIDEIELHLHPDWQQSIISRLRKTFPNIQFIITTHSPSVVQSVDKDSIRFLKESSDGKISAEIPEKQSQGVSLPEVLLDTFNLSDMAELDITDDVRKIDKLIAQNLFDTEEFLILYKKLSDHFGGDSITINKINSVKRIQELKAKKSNG